MVKILILLHLFMVIAESEVFWGSSYIEPVLPGLACQSTILTLKVLLSFHPVLEPLLFIAPAHCVPVHTAGLEGWIFASFSKRSCSAPHGYRQPNGVLLPNSWGFSACSCYVRCLISQKLEQPSWSLKEKESNLSSFTKKTS